MLSSVNRPQREQCPLTQVIASDPRLDNTIS